MTLLFSYWYAAARIEDVVEKPITRRICGEDITLYRLKNGQVRAVQAYCPHRGADFGLGYTKEEQLVCPYHGWEFDANGRLVCVPSRKDNACPDVTLRQYPVREEGNYIWIFPGNPAEADRIPTGIPSLVLQPGLRAVAFGAEWNAHYTRVVESVLDVAHLSFVHPNTIGSPDRPECDRLQFSVFEGEMIIFPPGNAEANQLPNLPRLPKNREEIERFTKDSAHIHFVFPNHWMLQVSMGKGRFLYQYVTFTPVDEERTVIYGLALRTHMQKIPFFDQALRRQSNKVLEQDRAVVESQMPKEVPLDIRAEVHVYADGPQVQYRRMLREALKQQGE